MVLISYDIADDKKRTKFSKYLRKFGHRLQYSVYMIDNSERLLNNIIAEIKNKFEKEFEQEDSVYIFKVGDEKSVIKFGYAKNEDELVLIV